MERKPHSVRKLDGTGYRFQFVTGTALATRDELEAGPTRVEIERDGWHFEAALTRYHAETMTLQTREVGDLFTQQTGSGDAAEGDALGNLLRNF